MKNYILIIVSLCVSFCAAQIKVQGTIINDKGDYIEDANISVLNSEIGTSTNAKGNYTLNITEGQYTLRISALGYAVLLQEVIVSKTEKNFNFSLKPKDTSLDEVVLTANKKEANAIDVPISVSALSSQKIEDTRTWDLSGLSALVPNYLYQESGVSFQQIQSIRGIQVFSENPAVATYIDGVNNLDIISNNFILTDVERIEVLRGPQGTLFGRNAMGGVVNIITKQPTNKTEGFIEAGFGNLNLHRHSFGIKSPLVKDKLFFGFNGLFQNRDGYWENDSSLAAIPNPDIDRETVGDQRQVYGNFFLKWLVNNKFSATLNVKAQKDWSDATGFFVSQPNEIIAFENPDKIYLSRVGEHDQSVVNTALTLKYEASDYILTSISTYQSVGLSFRDIDFPGFYHSFYNSEIGEKLPPQEVWSQELRVNSKAEDSKWNYTAGLYGFTQDAFEPSTNLAFELDASTYAIFKNEGRNSGLAAFGELSYDASEKLILTAGLRYDYEKRKATFNGFGDLIFDGLSLNENMAPITEEGEYNALSPKLAISYALTENTNLYASYTRGFRAGGINAQRLPEGLDQTFDPEFSDNFEIGYKLKALNNTLNFSASLFYIDWTDIQFFNLVSPGTFARENVGDATSWGFEIESSLIPSKGLQFDTAIGINETEYTNFDLERVDISTEEVFTESISGNSLSNAPSSTMFFGAQYTTDVFKLLKTTLRGELRNIGAYFTDIQNTLEQPNYTLVNARLVFEIGRYNLSFWGQNLTNETYLAFGNPDTSFGSRSVRTAAPRTYGMALNIKF